MAQYPTESTPWARLVSARGETFLCAGCGNQAREQLKVVFTAEEVTKMLKEERERVHAEFVAIAQACTPQPGVGAGRHGPSLHQPAPGRPAASGIYEPPAFGTAGFGAGGGFAPPPTGGF